MTLRGNLIDFSLPDVFQLVQLSRKTGVLRITGTEGEGSIWFREGEVFFAQSDWRTDRFGERLVSAQRITPAALERALEIQATEAPHGRRLGEILVAEGYLTRQVLEAFVLDQIQDTIFDLMRWDEGRFDFEILPQVLHEDIGLAVSVENIVMEGSRRLEEWQRVRKKVPSTDMVFKMATAPGEGTFEISLRPAEWSLLLLIDGTRSVHDLAAETHVGEFDVARMVYGLFSAGLLEVVDDAEVAERRSERERRDAARSVARGADVLPVTGVPRESADELAGVSSEASTEVAPGEADERAELAESADGAEIGDGGLEPEYEPELETQPGSELEEPPASEEVSASIDADEEPRADEGSCSGAADTPEAPEKNGPLDAGEPEPSLAGDSEPAGETTAHGIEPDVLAADESEVVLAVSGGAPPETARAWTWEPAARTGDLTKDLTALGLGEYPEELLVQTDEPAPVSGGAVAPEEPSALMEEIVAERMAITYSFEAVPTALEAATPASPPLSGAHSSPQIALREEPSAVAPGGIGTAMISTAPFVGDALSSEDDRGTDGEPCAAPGAEIASYVSTDAFIADLDGALSFSGGLGDELAALTGAGPSRPRPQGAHAASPQRKERPALRRDHAVDRALLIRIIEGIERL